MGENAAFPRSKKHKTLTFLDTNINNISHNATETNPVEAVLSDTDLLTQILTRVPPKPVITFQIVSKHWLSLISDPHFLVTHTRHHLTTHRPSSLSLFHYIKEFSGIRNDEPCICIETSSISIKCCLKFYPKLDVLEKYPFKFSPNILSYCNGLILCQYRNYDPYIVFNPTTQKNRLIPELLRSRGYEPGLGVVLAFEPLKSFHYKIIRFWGFLCHGKPMLYIDIFSSENGTWKEIFLQDPPKRIFPRGTRMVFWNGAIHWFSILNFHVSFILDEEKFTWDQIPINPLSFPENGEFVYFGKSDTGLLVIKSSSETNHPGTTGNGANVVFTVLEMNKDNCWSLKRKVDLRPLVSKYPEMNTVSINGGMRLDYSVLFVKSCIMNGEFSMVLAIPEKVILYEVGKGNGDNDYKVLREFPHHILSLYRKMNPCTEFIECLAPVL